MGVKAAASAEFYDRALRDRRNASWLPVASSPYALLYERTAALVPAATSVVELGCGTGRLASLLVPKARRYVGLDFAPLVIAEAERLVPEGSFCIADLRRGEVPWGEVYVANEVLEHLDDDLGLLGRLPVGAVVVLSVPSFDSASHVRHFPAQGDAEVRYGPLLDIDHVEYVPHGTRGRFFHLLRGVRR